MDLPLEVRTMIYEYCLVVSETIEPYKEYCPLSASDLAHRRTMPTAALLAVNRTIESEAAGILYGKNVWRITSKSEFLSGSNDGTLWIRRAPLFRNVALDFDRRGLDGPEWYEVVRSYENEEIPPDELIRILHNTAKDVMEEEWQSRLDLILEMLNLVSIVLNVDRLYCPTGCCRRVMLESVLGLIKRQYGISPAEIRGQYGDCYKVFKDLYDTSPPSSPSQDWKIWPPFRINVKGLHNPEEMELVREYGFYADDI